MKTIVSVYENYNVKNKFTDEAKQSSSLQERTTVAGWESVGL